mmetsp:Transcript_38956/g.69148  ORF Transcript_38956/g.69148 Transcript_38956/m.69148 type:complete len:437 (+) Transcript_38956:75-1385(+)
MFYGQPDGSGLDHRDDSEEIVRAISASAECSGSTPGSAFPGFDGDFYRDPDDVTRGLTMHPGEAPHFADFYREPDEFCKGPSMGAPGSHFGGLPFLAGDPKAAGFGNLLSTDYLKDAMTNKKTFEKSNKPPPLPTDTFFTLELTTLHALGEPDVIGNHLLDFLCKEVVSSITKVNQKKFSIKADVFVNNVMCTLKIRLYDFCDPRGFAVEFQRRSGDAVTYNVVFQKACQYMKTVKQKGMLVTGGSEASPTMLAPPPLPAEFVIPEVDLAPLFDMAGMVHIPSLQAEAASSLVTVAEDRLLAPLLCKGETFLAIQNLWQAQELEVAYPTSRLIGRLAEKDEAAQFFDANVLAQIIDRVRRNPDALVQQELAKALSVALQRKMATGASLQDSQIAALKPLLNDVLQEQAASNSVILEHLEAAQCSLNSVSQGFYKLG